MTYQTAYKLLVAAYKSAKGVMPQGIDMLKLKMKARQKVIDAKKVIEVNFDKGNNWMKAKPQSTKGKVAETEAEMIVRMNKQNKESVARLKKKKEKSLGEKLRDYDGDPDGMAGGGKVKKPFRSKVVDFLGGPSVVGAELGLSGLLEVYNILGMPLMKDGGKVKKKRKHDDNIDEEDIGEGESKERFLNKMPRPRNYPNLSEEEIILDKMPRPKRSDGIMELATGGMTNISDTYDNNPTLQSQYPNKQDYLDMFAQQTTTTTPQYATAYQSTGSTIAPINPIKPIIKIPQGGDGDDGPPPGPRGNPNFDYEYEALGGLYNKDNVPLTEEEQAIVDKEKSGLMNLFSLSPTIKAGKFVFNKAKAGAAATKKAIDDYFKKKAEDEAIAAQREFDRLNAIRQQRDAGSMSGGPGETTQGTFGSSVNDASTFSDYS
jgi:hypothetical protein